MSQRIVVSDAGPIHYLALIDCADVLESLFDHVLAPFAVRDELLHPNAPQKVKGWLLKARPWFEVSSVENPKAIRGLHRGESEALQLALQTKAAAILLDDLDARHAAKELGLEVIGTIAILERAAAMDLIDLPAAIQKLRQTNFFAPAELFEGAILRDRARRNR